MGIFLLSKRKISSFFAFIRDVAGADRSLLARRLLLLISDAWVMAMSFWAAFALRLNSIFPQALDESLSRPSFWWLAWELCWLVVGTEA